GYPYLARPVPHDRSAPAVRRAADHQAAGACSAPPRRSGHAFETRVRLVPAARLGRRLPVHQHHVCGEVVAVLEEGGAHAVGVHGYAELLEVADLLRVEPAGDDDLHVAEARVVERMAHVPYEL